MFGPKLRRPRPPAERPSPAGPESFTALLPIPAAQTARPSPCRALFAALAVTAAASCQSYNDRVAGAVDAFERGSFEQAETAFGQSEVTGSPFLGGAEAGMAAFTDGRFEEARAYFERAELAARDVEERAAIGAESLTESLLTLAINESQADYPGEGYEKVMLHVMLGLCHLTRFDAESVLVEARRVDELLTGEEELYGSEYGAGGIGHFMSAMAYELAGKPGEAYIDYQRMRDKGVGGDLVGSALRRLARRLGRADDLARWEEEFGEGGPDPDRESPSVVLIGGLGMGPAKYETRIDVPIDGSIFAWAVPSFDGGSGRAASLELVFPESGVHVRSAVVEDVAAVASENLSDRIAWISTRSAVRGLLKRQLADQLKSDEDTAWIGLAVDIFTIVSERADLRAWRTLPRAWVAARAYLPANEFVDIELHEVGGDRVDIGRYRLLEGETMFVVARALDSGLVVHVVGGEAFEPSTNPQDPEALEGAPLSGARMQ